MDTEIIREYCLTKHLAYEDHPFGELPICIKLNGRIFAQLYPDKITLKCTAFAGQMFRQAHPGIVVRGYHCPPVQQPYWNTVYWQSMPEEELLYMIDLAYETVLASFPKKVQAEIQSTP